MSENEIVLQGGNVTAVVRIGETVRRQLKPMSSTIHRLLLHLEAMKFDGAPRFLGIDEKQREILSFVSGETDGGQYPFLKPYMRSDEALTEMAWLLRKYHDATASFSREEKDEWMMAYPGKQNAEVICHNDAAPYNVVFRNGSPAALIDFDTACPGPRIWDIAYALYTFVPLTGSVPTFEGYGIPQPDNFLEQVEDRLGALCDTLVTRAANGDEAFARMVEEGHLEHYRKKNSGRQTALGQGTPPAEGNRENRVGVWSIFAISCRPERNYEAKKGRALSTRRTVEVSLAK